ncbi:hypothetical protein OG474_31015 [Kribbella sp. NBC_01505]|uniref:hypothetical protein n=1 Tax=Kribbella sp. NBC_01505 TaxID=2903580 RepID=UPI003863644F
MPLFYVAGASGSGKSTVCAELVRRGHPSYDVDADRLGVWLDGAGLSVDADTVRRRIAQRPEGFGSSEEELRRILHWHATVDADNARFGATLVDASRPVTTVADEVLKVAEEHR